MTIKLASIFIIVLQIVAWTGMFVSQTLPRTSFGHYTCWAAFFLAFSTSVVMVFKYLPHDKE